MLQAQHNEVPAELDHGADPHRELIKRQTSDITDTRKRAALQRLRILDGDLRELVDETLASTHYDPLVRSRLARHVKSTFNLGQDLVSSIAVAYQVQPRRRVGRARADAALAQLIAETEWWEVAQRLNALAWWVGPTLEVPIMRGGRMRRELITPDRLDVLVDEDDPLGDPIAAAWTTVHKGAPAVCVLDEERWAWYSGRRMELVEERVHGARGPDGDPMFPATLWRFARPPSEFDYWFRDLHRRAVDATAQIGAVSTLMDWIRRTQNRKLIMLAGRLEDLDPNAKIDPEKPILFDVSGVDAQPLLQAADLNQPLEDFAAHMRLIASSVFDYYGLDGAAPDYMNEPTSVAQLELLAEKRSAVRDRQLPYARRYDRESHLRLVAVARAEGHPLADKLPTLEQMLELEVEFQPLSRMEDPSKRKQLIEFEIGRGYLTDAEVYQRTHPELTLEECREEIRRKIQEQRETNDLKAVAARPLAMEVESEPEQTGRIGGQARPNDTETTDDDNRDE